MKKLLRVENNERIDRSDFEFATYNSFINVESSVANAILGNITGFESFSIKPFTLSRENNPVWDILRVEKGVASVTIRAGGEFVQGIILNEGQEFLELSLASKSDGDYNVYVKLTITDGEFDNRRKWNPTTAVETVANLATRKIVNWAVSVEKTSPGIEWVKVGELNMSGGAIQTTTNYPNFLMYEGSPDLDYESQWGSVNQRTNNRIIHGNHSLSEWVQFVNKKLDEISSRGTNPNVSTARRWELPASSLDDVAPLSGATGDFAFRGNIETQKSLIVKEDITISEPTDNDIRFINYEGDNELIINADSGGGGFASFSNGKLEIGGNLNFYDGVMTFNSSNDIVLGGKLKPNPILSFFENGGINLQGVELPPNPDDIYYLTQGSFPIAWGRFVMDDVGDIISSRYYNCSVVKTGVNSGTGTFTMAPIGLNYEIFWFPAEILNVVFPADNSNFVPVSSPATSTTFAITGLNVTAQHRFIIYQRV